MTTSSPKENPCPIRERDGSQPLAHSCCARAEAAEAKLAEVRAAYRTRYDCADDADPAGLMLEMLAAEAAEHERFKARGGELDALEAKLAEVERELAYERQQDAIAIQSLRVAEAREKALREALGRYRYSQQHRGCECSACLAADAALSSRPQEAAPPAKGE